MTDQEQEQDDGPFRVSDELLNAESKDYHDLMELFTYDQSTYDHFQQNVNKLTQWRGYEDDHVHKWSDAGSDQRHGIKKRVDGDLSYINYGKGRFNESVLFPGHDVNYAMIDQRYPVFRYRMMNFYIASLYGFQDPMNRFTKPQFIGRRYNVNGINSMDPYFYQDMESVDMGDTKVPKQPLKVIKTAAYPRGRYDFRDKCNVSYWRCELDDRVLKSSPKIFDVNMCCTHNGLEDIVKVFDPKDEDWARINYMDQHRTNANVNHFEDGGRCTKWKSPGHVWLEVPPDDVIVEFGASERPFIMDQTFCLTKPLRRRLVEDNNVSMLKRLETPSQIQKNVPCNDFDKVGGSKMEMTSALHQLEVTEVSPEAKMVQDVGQEIMKTNEDLHLPRVKEQIQNIKLRATGTFANSLLDDEEDARPVVMGEDDNEWQCCKLIHRTMRKELMQVELNDFRKFMKYAYGPEVEEDHFTAENPYCENDDEMTELSIPLVLQHSIDRRKRQRDNERGCERQSTFDIAPELFDRNDYRNDWTKKTDENATFEGVLTSRFEDQWEIIWQDWQTNPLTKEVYEEKIKKMRQWEEYPSSDRKYQADYSNMYQTSRNEISASNRRLSLRPYEHGAYYGYNNPLKHIEDCGSLAWTCKHAKESFKEWKENEIFNNGFFGSVKLIVKNWCQIT